MIRSNMICGRYIIEKKVNMIAITMEHYQEMERWMELVDISKYGSMKMGMIVDSITVGDLKKVKKKDRVIRCIMIVLILVIIMYT